MIEKDDKSVDKKTLKCEHGAYIRCYIWVEKVNAMSCPLVCGASRAKFRSVKPRFIGVHIASPYCEPEIHMWLPTSKVTQEIQICIDPTLTRAHLTDVEP